MEQQAAPGVYSYGGLKVMGMERSTETLLAGSVGGGGWGGAEDPCSSTSEPWSSV